MQVSSSEKVILKVWFSPCNDPLTLFNTLFQGHLQNCHPSHWRLLGSCHLWYIPRTSFLAIIANLPNPGYSTVCLFTVSPRISSLYCTTTRLTVNSFCADFLSIPACGTGLLFGSSLRASCFSSATSGFVSFSRPASIYDPSSLLCAIYRTVCLLGTATWACPLFSTNCLHHLDNWTGNLHNSASIHSKPYR